MPGVLRDLVDLPHTGDGHVRRFLKVPAQAEGMLVEKAAGERFDGDHADVQFRAGGPEVGIRIIEDIIVGNNNDTDFRRIPRSWSAPGGSDGR